MKIAITNDHGGVGLKNALMAAFPDIEWIDLGVQSDADRVDYPDYAAGLADAMARGDAQMAVAICGSGVGIGMALNRYAHIRAACCNEPYTAILCREHNDANVICFGGRLVGSVMATECLRIFLATEFLGGRYADRLEKLKKCGAS